MDESTAKTHRWFNTTVAAGAAAVAFTQLGTGLGDKFIVASYFLVMLFAAYKFAKGMAPEMADDIRSLAS